jgi:hypothetical protein
VHHCGGKTLAVLTLGMGVVGLPKTLPGKLGMGLQLDFGWIVGVEMSHSVNLSLGYSPFLRTKKGW